MSGSMSVGESSPVSCRPPYIPLLLTVPAWAAARLHDRGARSATSEGSPVPRSSLATQGYADRAPVGQNRDGPWAIGQERAQVLGAVDARRSLLPTPLAMSAIGSATSATSAAWSPAWREGRSRRHRPPPRRGHLARAHEERTLRPGGPRDAAGRLTTPVWNWPPEQPPSRPCPSSKKAIER